MPRIKPFVYIIIVNWKRYKDTNECLTTLKKLRYKNYKVVLIDNESNKRKLAELAKKFPYIITIKNSKNEGYVKANNMGICKAINNNAKYVLLLNNDTVIEPNFLDELIKFTIQNNFVGILTPKILYYKSNIIWSMGGKLSITTSIPRMIGQGKPSSLYKSSFSPDYAPGCALLINTEVINKVGMLDNRYFAYYEDVDLCYRNKKAGYKIKVVPQSIVWHKVSQSTIQKRKNSIGPVQAYYLARNGLVFGYLNLNSWQKLIYLSSQYFIKMPIYLLLKTDGIRSAVAYLHGIFDGTRFLLNPKIDIEYMTKYVS